MERLDNINTRIAVRAILLNRDGKVLLTRRASGTYAEDEWCMAGGKLDEGEHPRKAVIREVAEEIGIMFTPSSYYGEIENPNTSRGEKWITHYFIGETNVLPAQFREEEISEVRFFSQSDLQEIDIAFDHKEVLLQFFRDRSKD